MASYPGELRADFQQFYGLNLDDLGEQYTYRHAACLAYYLPRDSRLCKAIKPQLEWDDQTYILRLIEYWTHCIAYHYSKDAQHRRNQPKPLDTPLDRAKEREKQEKQERDLDKKDEIARKLNIPQDRR